MSPIRATQTAVLVGFDRSGTSMVAKLLAEHPDVECLFQPDSGTVIHRTQWEHWPAHHSEPDAERFFRSLGRGELDRTFIASAWFENHSSSFEFVPGSLHVLKSTKLHFKIDWLRARFPELPVFALVREPRAVLASLVRNDFHRTWYGEGHFDELRRFLATSPVAPERLRELAGRIETDLERMALMIATRTEVLLAAVDPDHVIDYAKVLSNPNKELNAFTARFGKAAFDFAAHIGRDYNVIGKGFERPDLYTTLFTPEEHRRLDVIFARTS